MLEWIIILGMAVAMYIILYKYERRKERMQDLIDSNKENIDKNYHKIKKHRDKIQENHGRLDEHYNHFEKLWVSSPKHSNKHEDKKED